MIALTLLVGCSCPVSLMEPSPHACFWKQASKPGYPNQASPDAGSTLKDKRTFKSVIVLRQATMPLSDLIVPCSPSCWRGATVEVGQPAYLLPSARMQSCAPCWPGVASLCMPERSRSHCRLRLTRLGDGGCILGICNSHMLYAGAG